MVLQLQKPENDGLNKLLHISNDVAESFGQPPLYTDTYSKSANAPPQKKRHGGTYVKDTDRDLRGGGFSKNIQEEEVSRGDMTPYFHISIGWSLKQPLKETEEKLDSQDRTQSTCQGISVDSAKVKVGNTVTTMALPTKVDAYKGFLDR